MREYEKFVLSRASEPSTDFFSMTYRLNTLHHDNPLVHVSRLLAGSLGLSSEAGELQEIVKKIIFQGKDLDKANIFHMKRELGDIMFYLSLACSALGTTLEEVALMNREKLEARYPEGFTVNHSEFRQEGDV